MTKKEKLRKRKRGGTKRIRKETNEQRKTKRD